MAERKDFHTIAAPPINAAAGMGWINMKCLCHRRWCQKTRSIAPQPNWATAVHQRGLPFRNDEM
jgi:hypothetical protein